MTRSAGLRARFGRLPVVTRLVLAVAITMSLVLTGTAGLVYWRVQTALDRQLHDDLAAYRHSLDRAVRAGTAPPPGPSGSLYQVLDTRGRVLAASDAVRHRPLLSAAELDSAAHGHTVRRDVGSLLPITPDTLRLQARRVRAGGQSRVVVAAVRRGHRDEALRELLAQLAFASVLALIAASFVGYRTARAALRPVERYRSGAATLADGAQNLRLDVPADRDDEITRLGHTLNRMLDRLEASAVRERRFVADASHELRTPLALLRAELDVALHRPRSAEELTGTLRAVEGEVQRLIDLSNALLALEELGGTDHVVRAPVCLADLVEAAVAPHLRTAGREGRALTVDAAGTTVEVDARWLRPALGNLVDNALRHAAGPVRVTAEVHGPDTAEARGPVTAEAHGPVTSQAREPVTAEMRGQVIAEARGPVTAEVRRPRLRLVVADEGPGFPPDFLPRAFDRFARAEASRTSEGSGLGLAFVQAVATAHGGTAHAENTGRGAAVVLDLPC
ncbi:HAMP domain-containing sensor histidine kinase [Streptomyces collinus]|uniref:histidine kinase n=1 Tax=Streptomyces collinus (strain DSM 40733 / Tue 365) TaxID=1214242 RepID=S5UZ72_STRC3|nr:ATP-binding protein [Streptomyces collinus]AGS71061.1 ATPase domain-containing protein [Streptomyces collinus Tu 365]UJA09712.1 HAMP domain-containing protein [Streptomyces collinus]UJA15424.1 HAMP domain-containing protein [Streptomyces collinus]